jgi:solute:Na+ symporter, SSS family
MNFTPVHFDFSFIDWFVIFAYLGLTTWVGHKMRGKQGTIRDFFLGGRSLPWPAVTGSIIATEISGVTFIGVAGTVFALHGNFTYIIWAFGSILARIIVAKFFVPKFFEEEIYSPYDYMKRRLGSGAKTLATIVFTIGTILGQSVRVFVAAIPLQVVTGMDIYLCIAIIGIFAVIWTLMGGMRTVIWTDVMQFGLFTFGGLLALFWIVGSLDGGLSEYWQTSNLYARTDWFDTRMQAHIEFTLWVAIFAVPFQNLTAFGVDQLNAQRMFCCKDAKSASKALIWSSCGQLLTLMMLLVGAALVVHYDKNPFTPREAVVVMGVPVEKGKEQEAGEKALELMKNREFIMSPAAIQAKKEFLEIPGNQDKAKEFKHPEISSVPVPLKQDYVFPMWIVTALPVGLSGLVLAGVFAAAISSLDSVLAALSQTSLSLIYHPESKTDEELEQLNLVQKSKILVVAWGIFLTSFTFGIVPIAQHHSVLPLAFGMTTYTMGPLLAIFLCAMLGKGSVKGLVVGFAVSILITVFLRTDVWMLTKNFDLLKSLGNLPQYSFNPETNVLTSKIASPWIWPLTTFVTLGIALLIPRKNEANKAVAA